MTFDVADFGRLEVLGRFVQDPRKVKIRPNEDENNIIEKNKEKKTGLKKVTGAVKRTMGRALKRTAERFSKGNPIREAREELVIEKAVPRAEAILALIEDVDKGEDRAEKKNMVKILRAIKEYIVDVDRLDLDTGNHVMYLLKGNIHPDVLRRLEQATASPQQERRESTSSRLSQRSERPPSGQRSERAPSDTDSRRSDKGYVPSVSSRANSRRSSSGSDFSEGLLVGQVPSRRSSDSTTTGTGSTQTRKERRASNRSSGTGSSLRSVDLESDWSRLSPLSPLERPPRAESTDDDE